MKLCPKCGLAQIKAGTCLEPCQEIEDYLRAENAKLLAQVETLAEALRQQDCPPKYLNKPTEEELA